MKIGILFDGMSALAPQPDVQILESVEQIETILQDAGHHCVRFPVDGEVRWVERLRRARVDLVFNLCEGIDGIAELEAPSIGVLHLLGVPFTGASARTLQLCLDKDLVNTLLDRAGIPVPRWTVARPGDEIESVGFPAICKPAAEDASLGIEQRSVVRSLRALKTRVAAMHQIWDAVLIQRFVQGREINVGIVGDRVLPISEIDFGAMPRGKWNIVSYSSKWATGSVEDLGTAPRCPADLPEDLAAEIEQIALAAWAAVGGSGYGRVDLRIDESGRPWVLEVNANADISADAGLARMAKVAGMSYPDLILAVCDVALAKRGIDRSDRWERTLQLSGVG
jgi:D-alanine-D-alanine ligase